MKAVRISGILILSALLIAPQQHGYSQDTMTDKELIAQDSLRCGKLISTFREFYKNDLFDMALES